MRRLPPRRAPSAASSDFPTRHPDEPGDAERDHLAHRERRLGPFHAVDRQDPRVGVEEMPRIAACDSGQDVDRAAETVRLHDLRHPGQFGDDPRELGLAHTDVDEGLQREADHRGRIGAFVGKEHAGLLEAGHPGLDGVAREAEPLGESDDGGAWLDGERVEKVEVDTVECGHSAKR
ncbi:hypothetical protein ABE10_25435 [Bacillus toyonensis]|nr:hypothetical protein [Bacillus toyonensis]